MWLGAYGHDPLARSASAVVAERVYRPVDGDNYVVLDPDFTTLNEAEQLLRPLKSQVWPIQAVSPALAGGPKTRTVERLTNPG